MKLDILALAAHPDDVELSASGTLALHAAMGKKVGIVDLTRGELGTRGTPELRKKEADAAARILGLTCRENLSFEDGFFSNDRTHRLKVIEVIRRYQPEIVLANAVSDRHPDHGQAAELIKVSCFLSGLVKIPTFSKFGQKQEPWRPKAVYHYIQDRYLPPALVVDITDYWDIKMKSIQAFSSQFFIPDTKSPTPKAQDTPISTPQFIRFWEGRAREMGRLIGVEFGEGFTMDTPPGTRNLFDLIP